MVVSHHSLFTHQLFNSFIDTDHRTTKQHTHIYLLVNIIDKPTMLCSVPPLSSDLYRMVLHDGSPHVQRMRWLHAQCARWWQEI